MNFTHCFCAPSPTAAEVSPTCYETPCTYILNDNITFQYKLSVSVTNPASVKQFNQKFN